MISKLSALIFVSFIFIQGVYNHASDVLNKGKDDIDQEQSDFLWREGYSLLISNKSIFEAHRKFVQSYQLYPSIQASEMISFILSSITLEPESNEQTLHCIQSNQNCSKFYEHLSLGTQQNILLDYHEAMINLNLAKLIFPNSSEVHFQFGISLTGLGRYDHSYWHYSQAIHFNTLHVKSYLNLGSIAHLFNNPKEAMEHYSHGLAMDELLRSFGLMMLGKLFVTEETMKLQLNLIAALYQLNRMEEALQKLSDLQTLLKTINESLIKQQLQQRLAGNEELSADLKYQLQRNEALQVDAISYQLLIRRSIAHWQDREVLLHHWLSHSLQLSRRMASPDPAIADDEKSLYTGPGLPFDAILFGAQPQQILSLARAISNSVQRKVHKQQLSQHKSVLEQDKRTGSAVDITALKTIRIGFVSSDICNHPTAHMLEGLFDVIHYNQDQVPEQRMDPKLELILYSLFGTGDAIYRPSFEKIAHAFFDIQSWSLEYFWQNINHFQQVQILIDLQVHTMGNRLALFASNRDQRIITVNYLVYPGTSGAKFIDYCIVDKIVVSLEYQCKDYSEKLIVMPGTYQLSYYRRYDDYLQNRTQEKERQRVSSQGGQGDTSSNRMNISYIVVRSNSNRKPFIFVNFNKLDKIDPYSFQIWMNIMRRVPNSILWLLHSSLTSPIKLHQSQLRSQASMQGIHPSRLRTLPWVDKQENIRRQGKADLFLDTLVYGAHSTATDALRGGLPVLTMRGPAFPNRVGASIYHSLTAAHTELIAAPYTRGTARLAAASLGDILVVDTAQQFEEVAVRLATQKHQQQQQKSQLTRSIHTIELKRLLKLAVEERLGCFDVTRQVQAFHRAMRTIVEIKELREYNTHRENSTVRAKLPHLIIL